MSTIDQRLMVVVNAFKQAIQTGMSPGLSVNTHPNVFFLHVNGEIDLKRAAELALERLDNYVRAELQRQVHQPAANDPTIL